MSILRDAFGVSPFGALFLGAGALREISGIVGTVQWRCAKATADSRVEPGAGPLGMLSCKLRDRVAPQADPNVVNRACPDGFAGR
jgi:hypothetical protein